jgi:hypothetical protein
MTIKHKKMGRPRHEDPSEQTYLRFPRSIIDWMKKNGNKEKVIKFARKDLNKQKKHT